MAWTLTATGSLGSSSCDENPLIALTADEDQPLGSEDRAVARPKRHVTVEARKVIADVKAASCEMLPKALETLERLASADLVGSKRSSTGREGHFAVTKE